MGTTLHTLHIFGGQAEAGLLRETDTLRVLNAPWLSILPDRNEKDRGAWRLAALARKQVRPCILFSYRDDDFFTLQLYLNGKQAGCINSLGGTSKLSTFEAVMDGGDVRDWKMLSKCTDIDEALALAEELLGTALYDMPDAEPRSVPRGKRVLNAIRDREKIIRSRPNRFRLNPLPRHDWPRDVEARLRALEYLQQNGNRHLRSTILHGLAAGTDWTGAQNETAIACSYLNWGTEGGIICLNTAENRLTDIHPRIKCSPVLALSGERPIVACFKGKAGYESIACLNPDGSTRWHFTPELPPEGRIGICAARLPGELLVFTDLVRENPTLWKLSTKDGSITAQCSLSDPGDLRDLHFLPELQAYVYYSSRSNCFVMLDANLSLLRKVAAGNDGPRYDVFPLYAGNKVWKQDISTGDLLGFNLDSGEHQRIHTELPGHLLDIFPDGCIASMNGTGRTVMLHDPNGMLLSRLHLKGEAAGIIHREGESLLVETQLGAPADAAPEELIRCWRIEPK